MLRCRHDALRLAGALPSAEPVAADRLGAGEKLAGHGDGDGSGLLGGHLRQADGTGKASERRLAMAALAQPAEEGRPLAVAADEAEESEIAALQDLIADFEIDGMAMGHHQKKAARGCCRHLMPRRVGAFGFDIGRQSGGKHLGAAIDPANPVRQQPQHLHQRPADMAGAEEVEVLARIDHSLQKIA